MAAGEAAADDGLCDELAIREAADDDALSATTSILPCRGCCCRPLMMDDDEL